MSRGRWEERDTPTEYRARAPLADALLDLVAAQHTLMQRVGALSEQIRALETRRPDRSNDRAA